eukprot:m.429496 g.429496  ORF g.429496 m.429496 type:complete len:53 (+) comp20236_c6_seq5:184-342(+)
MHLLGHWEMLADVASVSTFLICVIVFSLAVFSSNVLPSTTVATYAKACVITS